MNMSQSNISHTYDNTDSQTYLPAVHNFVDLQHGLILAHLVDALSLILSEASGIAIVELDSISESLTLISPG